MTPVATHDPLFTYVTSPYFRRDHIADLAAGRCVAIVVPGCVPQSICAQMLDAFASVEFDSYGTDRVYPPVMRFGVGVSDHRPNGVILNSYWDELAANRQAWRDLKLSYDPFELCRKALEADWPNPVKVGTWNGRELGAGVVREPNNGFIVHFDDASREFRGKVLDANIIAQFAFNLYISVPEKGGETVVWRHRWQPADETFRRPHSYGYDDEVVGKTESFEMKPAVGQALLFNPSYFHAVRPSQDSRRIALGFSVGLSDIGELLAWG